jgi:acetylornithine deacetylase/succinyl-diaminopimelate desuccinylase-like protein
MADSKLEKQRQVMRHIDEDKVVNILQGLVRVPSVNPPGDEGRVASEMAKMMEKAGLETSVEEFLPNRSNAYDTVQGREKNGRILLLNGHLDVVPPGDGWSKEPFGGEIKDGRLYGRGSCDMKGGLAETIVAANALVDAGVELRHSSCRENHLWNGWRNSRFLSSERRIKPRERGNPDGHHWSRQPEYGAQAR